MSRRTFFLASAAVAGAVTFLPSPAAGDDEPEVARMWQARCGSCHTIPDPALRTDRAWLDQVHRTA